MGMQSELKSVLSEEDQLRSDLYGFLANQLQSAPDEKRLNLLSNLQGDDSAIGLAFRAVARIAGESNPSEISEEYEALFIGMGRGELVPFASYYLTGFLNEKPLAKLRNTMRELNIERKDGVSEPEDHVGFLMEMMAGLIQGNYSQTSDAAAQKDFFETHIVSWASHFFSDLEGAKNSRLYQPIGSIGKLFMEIESTALKME